MHTVLRAMRGWCQIIGHSVEGTGVFGLAHAYCLEKEAFASYLRPGRDGLW